MEKSRDSNDVKKNEERFFFQGDPKSAEVAPLVAKAQAEHERLFRLAYSLALTVDPDDGIRNLALNDPSKIFEGKASVIKKLLTAEPTGTDLTLNNSLKAELIAFYLGWRHMAHEFFSNSSPEQHPNFADDLSRIDTDVFDVKGVAAVMEALNTDSLARLLITAFTPMYFYTVEVKLRDDNHALVRMVGPCPDLLSIEKGDKLERVVEAKPLFAALAELSELCPSLLEVLFVDVTSLEQSTMLKRMLHVAGVSKASNPLQRSSKPSKWDKIIMDNDDRNVNCPYSISTHAPIPLFLPQIILKLDDAELSPCLLLMPRAHGDLRKIGAAQTPPTQWLYDLLHFLVGRWGLFVCRKYLEPMGMIHADVKKENIFVTNSAVHLADFGESKLRSTSPFVELRNARFNLTQRSEHARIKTEYSYVFDLSEFTQIFRSAIPADFVVSDTRYPFESPAEALNHPIFADLGLNLSFQQLQQAIQAVLKKIFEIQDAPEEM